MPGKGRHRGERAVRLHESEAAGRSRSSTSSTTIPTHNQPAVEARLEGCNVARNVRGKVRVRGGGVPARHHFDDRRDVRGQGDLGEANCASERGDRPLVVGVQGGVLKDDGQGPEARGVEGLQIVLDSFQVRRLLDPDGLARDGDRVRARRRVRRGVCGRVQPRPPASLPRGSTTLSSTSTTASCRTPGHRTARSKMAGRAWLPMWRRSRKPAVMARAQRSPSRSSNAFVATVVPMRMEAMREVSKGDERGCGMPVSSSRMRRMPSRGASG